MKKLLFTLVAICISSFAMAQNAKILRHHNGAVTQYNAGQISNAMSEAIDGDTIYLSDGVFNGFTITKAITIIGTGQTTRISGDISVSIPGTPTLTSRLLDALNISGTIEVKSAVNGINIRKCEINTVKFSGSVSESIIDRCYISSSFALSSYVNGLTVTNSYIKFVYGSASTPDFASFVNCNIYGLCCQNSGGNASSSYYPVFKGNLINCILYRYLVTPGDSSSSSYNCMSSAVYMINCLFSDYINTSLAVKSKCYSTTYTDFTTKYMGSNTSNLSTYLGNDGTIVGMYGGTTPYTLTPSTPTVTSSNITVDTAKKELNVSIKVQANN